MKKTKHIEGNRIVSLNEKTEFEKKFERGEKVESDSYVDQSVSTKNPPIFQGS